MTVRTSTLGGVEDVGDLSAPPGSRLWAIAVRLNCQVTLNDERGDAKHLAAMLRLLREHKGHRQLADRRGRPFATYEGFCLEPQPFGLGYRKDDIDRIIGERKDAATKAEVAKPVLTHEEAGKKGGRGKKASYVVTSFRGNSSDYLSAKIKRDSPVIHEQQKAGKFKSVRAAARAAGLVKPEIRCLANPPALARQVRSKFTPEQVKELVRLLTEDHRK